MNHWILDFRLWILDWFIGKAKNSHSKSSSQPPVLRRLFATALVLIISCWSLMPEVAIGLQSQQTSIQPYLDRVIKQLTEFRLDNGLKFIILERHQAPVVSFLTYADVGGIDEPDGQTGVAHFLEHLAFKGTKRIGTTDYKAEQPLLERLEQLDNQIRIAKAQDQKDDLAKLQTEFKSVEAQAIKLVKQNEIGQIVEQAGGVGLNANTSTEATRYFYSFPANKLELWMSLESERFLEPVFREFYKEKDVILEERRMRVENSPIGMMVEKFNDTAFTTHPYRRPVIGYDEDIRNLTPSDVKKFFDTYYVPSNLAIAIVGDVNPTEVKKLAQIYFGRYPAKPKPQQKLAPEPKQTATREVTLQLSSQPWYLEGYHRPPVTHPDNAAYDIISSLLSDGRTSRLYKSLIEKQRLALAAQGSSGFPGDKYPNLMLFYALTAPGHTVDELAVALGTEIERLKTEPVSETELQRVKTQARAGLLRSLDSNMGMAQQLLEYEVKTGSWRNLFKQLDDIAAVTPADIQRVAQATFTPENRTIGKLLSKEA
ncbi:insulinase family protein [Anabaena cylindrica FACHB-243]|uniref:Processing peptidase n=1 Tax=Anabaena cylindrica (strain ATCC 27899 / PCC 7122) TaxID=272123 RepID=K9Z991_ANACC|nr:MULTISPECIES: pitrilysin family protein [Anabaena]AFZ55753.1 processing peptidase [Anabaena cylindrica PCC 7122]MBD2420245.1 insulinase family protein [Anabaena cylindrica FACHB-243]MBY5282141.1 insulinase family protein [Anabaena sp. CCAP 1446/1C]MBY5309561.1 insulinase family protein [Anabaena sp. CCAP 1446/1C]MCM2406101.1 insulinase family protein [Anabaena sp. CCAP 1446/1C]